MMYFPYDEMPYKWMVLTVRTRTDAKAMLEEIRTATQSIDPDQPISQTRTLDGLLAETLVPWRFSMALLTAFAGLALILAAAGIYGVISYTVGQRTSEIGIRMTLGAQPRDVLRMVVWKGLAVVAIGMAAGVASALFLTRFLTTQIYGVRPTDPLTFAVIAVLLGIVALCATYIPARRATHVDPVIALRYE
jgi:putative ABC transport system permease protein